MKILSLGSDINLFKEGSLVSERIKNYGDLVEELHIINLVDSHHQLLPKQLFKNVWVYPTNSSSKFTRIFDAIRLGRRLVKDKGFVRGQSLITAQDLDTGFAGLWIKRRWRIPLEVQMHTDPFSPYFSGVFNFVRKLFAKTVLRGADGIRVVSDDLAKRVKEINPKAYIYTLPIYIDKQKWVGEGAKFDIHSLYPWTFIMLAVSRLSVEKNLPMALQCLAKVRETYPNTGLLIVGSGPEESNLKSLVKKLKLDGFVEFAGWQDDLVSYYRTANVFIQTSLYEGYGLSLVEAGLNGLPVVTTNVGLAKELESGKEAYIYPVGRVDLMAQGVIDLINNNYKRESVSLAFRQFLDKTLLTKEDYLRSLQESWVKIIGHRI